MNLEARPFDHILYRFPHSDAAVRPIAAYLPSENSYFEADAERDIDKTSHESIIDILFYV